MRLYKKTKIDEGNIKVVSVVVFKNTITHFRLCLVLETDFVNLVALTHVNTAASIDHRLFVYKQSCDLRTDRNVKLLSHFTQTVNHSYSPH